MGTAAGAAKARAKREAKHLEAPSPVSSRTVYRVGIRPLKWGGLTFKVGEKFPFADQLPRLESWLRTGRLVKA